MHIHLRIQQILHRRIHINIFLYTFMHPRTTRTQSLWIALYWTIWHRQQDRRERRVYEQTDRQSVSNCHSYTFRILLLSFFALLYNLIYLLLFLCFFLLLFLFLFYLLSYFIYHYHRLYSFLLYVHPPHSTSPLSLLLFLFVCIFFPFRILLLPPLIFLLPWVGRFILIISIYFSFISLLVLLLSLFLLFRCLLRFLFPFLHLPLILIIIFIIYYLSFSSSNHSLLLFLILLLLFFYFFPFFVLLF